MGRVEELAKVEAQIQVLAQRRQQIAEDYAKFAARIAGQVEKILKDAEVYDVIHALEVGRDKRRQDNQTQADLLGQEIEKLVALRTTLQVEASVDTPAEAPPEA